MAGLSLGLDLGLGSRNGISYTPEATALFARMTVQPSFAEKQAINTAIVDLKTLTLWDRLDALYVFASHDRQAARLNWVADQYNITELDSPNITFTTGVGFAGNGTSSALRTGFIPSTAISPKYVLNSASLGFWSESAAQFNGIEMGNDNSLVGIRGGSDVANHRINTPGGGSVVSVSDGSGLFVSSRTSSSGNDNILSRDGVALPPNTVPGTTLSLSAREIWVLGRNNTTPSYCARPCSLAFIGSGFTTAELLQLYNVFA